MRVAIIGLGGMGRGHAEALVKCPAATEVVGCDRDERLAKAAADQLGIRTFTDLDRLLAEATPRAAVVATPPAAHAANIRACFDRGIAVLTEKPICTDPREAAELVARAAAADLAFQCGFQIRYCGFLRAIRELIDAGELGRVSHVGLVQYSGPIPKPGYFSRERTGGLFYEKLCHQVDLFRHLLGEPERCMAISAPRVIAHYGVDDNATSVFAFPAGALGTIRFDIRRAAQLDGTAVPPRAFEGHAAGHFNELTVTGDRGSATYDPWSDTVDVIRFNHRPDLLSERVRRIDLAREYPGSNYDMRPQDGDFLERVAKGQPPRYPASDALTSMAWVEKAEESLRRGGAWIS